MLKIISKIIIEFIRIKKKSFLSFFASRSNLFTAHGLRHQHFPKQRVLNSPRCLGAIVDRSMNRLHHLHQHNLHHLQLVPSPQLLRKKGEPSIRTSTFGLMMQYGRLVCRIAGAKRRISGSQPIVKIKSRHTVRQMHWFFIQIYRRLLSIM